MNEHHHQAPPATDAASTAGSTSGETSPVEIEERVIEALRQVYDPEIPVNIYELGLIYDVRVADGDAIDIKMTLTSPHCPVAETLPLDVKRTVASIPGIGPVDVEVVWDPTWNPDMMTEAAKLELGFF